MDSNTVNKIVSALELIHSPKSSNEARQEAQSFLEQVKKQQESPFWGYELGLPNQNAVVVRHFGLTLLQNSINRYWQDYDEEKKLAIRKWVIDLSSQLQENDPHYIKEKLSFLWVAVAKRCWASFLTNEESKKATFQEFTEGWSTMDQDLLNLWLQSPQTRELVLIIFRTLFEDVYILDDSITSKRSYLLCSACSNVLLPDSLLTSIYEPNVNLQESKATKDGWFLIWLEFLNESIESSNERSIIKTLETFKTCLTWPYSSLLTQSNILQTLLKTITSTNIRIKILSVDCLHILFTRSFNQSSDLNSIASIIFKPEGIQLLTNIYESISNDPDDIDDELYAFTKKFTEMVVGLSEHLHSIDTSEADISNYLKLILETTNSDSLTVGAISLNFWGFMLRETENIKMIEGILPDLLEVSASKLINFNDLNKEHISQKFQAIDFNSQTDSYSFLANYKKLIDDIVRLSICIRADEGLNWLYQRLERFFSSELGHKAITSQTLNYQNEPFILTISQLDITEATVRGIIRWKIWYGNQDYNEKLDALLLKVDALLQQLLNVEAKDPVVLKKFTQTYVQFAPLLKDQSIFKIIEKLLTICTYEYPDNASDELNSSIKDLRNSCGSELNRLAFMMPDNLKNILDDLERVFETLLPRLSTPEAVTFKSFLLVVSQRTSIPNKEERFIKIVEPEITAWTDPETMKGLSDLHWFMERLGIVKIAEYFESRKISPDVDLLSTPMDEAGLQLKSELKQRWSAMFPIRTTRLLIQYSIEKLPKDSQYFKDLLKLWKPRVVPIVPHILQLLYQIQAYHDPENWKTLPAIVQSFVRDTTTERFWQMGVSIQSRDEFLEESVKAMHTLRDFADSVGHIVRYTREYVFLSVASITNLGDTFYTIPNIADVFWKAATTEKVGITLHSWKHLINIMLRSVVKNCPTECVNNFMSELLPQVFVTLDELMMAKWEKVYISGFQVDENDEQLSEEMMEEHLLRQVTQTIIRLLVDCVGQYSQRSPLTDTQLEIRKLIFSNKAILAPFLQLCSHLIMFKDSKSSYNVILIFRAILNELVLKDEEVDKFLCDSLTKSLVHFLTNDIYHEGQGDAAYVLASLYITMRVRGSYMTQVLKSYLPNTTDAHISKLEKDLNEAKNLKEQRNALLLFLQTVKDNDDFDDEKYQKNRKTQLENIAKKKKAESDIMNDPFVENGAIGNLFGEE